MARQVQTVITVTCDACTQQGTEQGESKSYTFGWQGTAFEIDLCETHAGNLEQSIEPWIGFGRRSEVRNVTPKPQRRAGKSGRDLKSVREWAKSNGYQLGDRGRIPREIVAAYEKQSA